MGEYALQVKLVFPDGTEGDVIQVPIVVKAGWYRSVGAYWAYGVLIVILLYIIYWHFKRKNTRRLMHRDREILLRESLNVEKMKLEQKQEIDTMRNRLLMLFVQKLRTPLSLIIGPLKDMLEELKLIPGFAARGQVAYRNSLRMLDACNQLLAIYGHSSLNEKLQLAPYQVEKLIDNNLFDIREILKVYPIHFQYEKRVKKELEFYVDKRKVEFIIHNLLTNAFAHINYAGNVSLTISETMEENQHYVTITVEDDGNASINSLGQILPGNKMAGSEPGFIEVGFTVMQRMMEIHHGKISLVDSPEKNAKISVSFPLDKSVLKNDPNIEFVDPEKNKDIEFGSMEIAQLNSMAAEDIVQSTSGTKKTLLIVEDQRDIRLYLKILFDKEYNLLMATNGQEGVDMAIKELPDLIICDIMMPVKDGFECCREVKEGLETCGIPFIMLTAKVEDEDVVHGLEIGADDYVLKPFTPSILKAKVRALLNSRQVLKQMYTKLFMLPGADTAGVSETEQPDEHVKVEDPFISSVIKIVEDNIGKADFSVKKLAAEMNMSQPTLYRKVKQNTDYTIIELIRGVRMRRAAVLLKTKQYAVQEVAEMVGYNDIPTFRKHFVDAFGTTPSTYE
ncbi:response regulator [Bacteroides ovatus]|uniref:hybrid sensor histidine kinase/response regulator transcription factor n=1 Tax=Bacteroides ovatus TaxID=28116 RepID=UPI0032C14754